MLINRVLAIDLTWLEETPKMHLADTHTGL